uniref:Phytochrome n=1 Tax=Entransia fimbriata TaxID=130991 RepID=A0A059UBG0_9VIRI|nr:phytochrome [Entransia fimbriata]
MSTNTGDSGSRMSGASSGSAKQGVRLAQTSADAKLAAVYDASNESGGSFDYTQTVEASKSDGETVPIGQVTAYLQRMQRGGYTQAFGWLLVVEEENFKVIAFSENAFEMMELSPQAVPSVDQPEILGIGTDSRQLFNAASATALEKAIRAADLNLVNPVHITTATTNKAFYAILHRIEVGVVIDFEPIDPKGNLPSTGALQSHKLAAKAINRLQSLPSGDISLLCDTVVEEVRELTGYDRVMAYKFHEDEHGEVIAEIRRADLEPFLGLHYPATDIPQASRFLFMKNRVRSIADCHSSQCKVIQADWLKQPISLAGSQIRGVHRCHLEYMENMGSIGSLVMAVITNEPEEATTTSSGGGGADSSSASMNRGRRLWGLIVCHHTVSRTIPFPLRSACEFLMQVFGLQLNMEVELANQMREKHILRTQTLLCDMLLRDAPVGIVSQSPNIMDLVKCDGAALLYNRRIWLLGTCPSEDQVRTIAQWLLDEHKDSTGLSTDSLLDAGFPAAQEIGDRVCGLAAARITPKDFLFWFRGPSAKTIKWAGAQHTPGDVDDGRKMHPRSSFQAFLEVVKTRSLPWEDAEMDAIHSLQLILRGSFQEMEGTETRTLMHSRLSDLRIQGMDELSTVANEMVRLIETATAPILAVDANGNVNGWNGKVAELTGLRVEDAMGHSLVKELVHPASEEAVERLLCLALSGEEEQNVEIKLRTWGAQKAVGESVILVVNACSSRDVTDSVVGVCFVGQDVTGEKMMMDKYTRVSGDYATIVHSPNVLIPPIFGTDEFGYTTEWNPAMVHLTGVPRLEISGKLLVGEVFGGLLKLESPDAMTKFMIVLNLAMDGQNTDKYPFAFVSRKSQREEVLLTVNKRMAADGAITGVFCFIHQASRELQDALAVQQAAEKVAEAKAKELAYIRQEIKNPLDGIMFTRSFIEHTDLNDDQKQLVETSATCEKQLRKILDDMDLNSIEEGYLELECAEFTMASVLNAVVSQGMITSSKKGLQLFCDTPPEFKSMSMFGDSARVQQVLADFLQNAIQFTPANGWVEIKAAPVSKKTLGGVQSVHLEFRVSHSGSGLPEDLQRQMYDRADAATKTQEGLGLSMCRKLVKLMGGEVAYVREAGRPFFKVDLELPLAQMTDAASTR